MNYHFDKTVTKPWMRDLAFDAQLDKIALDNVPKKQKELKVVIPHHEYKKPIRLSVEERNQRDLALEVQLARISTDAIVKTWEAPKKIQSHVTQEMIADYQNEQNQPIEIGGKQYKYRVPDSTIDLEPYVEPNALRINTEEELRIAITAGKQQCVDHYEEAMTKLGELDLDEKFARQEFDAEMAKIQLSTADPYQKQEMRNLVRSQFEQDMADLENEKLVQRREAQAGQDGLQTIDDDAQKIRILMHENETEKQRVDKANQSKLSVYQDELNSINNIKMSQNIGEDNASYADRLQKAGVLEVSDTDIEQSALLYITEKLKKDLREITLDNAKAMNVIKMLSPDERTATHKRFTGLKAEYLKNYGFNNKAMSDREIHGFILDFLSKPPLERKGKEVDLRPLTRDVGTDNNVSVPTDELINEYVKIFGSKPHHRLLPENILARIHTENPSFGIVGLPTITPRPMSGHGLTTYPHQARLGKLIISPHKLYYENMLVVLNQDGKHMTGFRNKKVSDAFASLVMKITNKEHLSKHDYLLPLGERELFDALIHVAHLHKSIETEGFAPMKKRLELIEGEIEAGNTNHELLSEAHGILYKLALAKVITHPSAKKHLAYLKSL